MLDLDQEPRLADSPDDRAFGGLCEAMSRWDPEPRFAAGPLLIEASSHGRAVDPRREDSLSSALLATPVQLGVEYPSPVLL